MRNFLACFASLVAASAVAHADPIAVTESAESSTAPSTYVQGGVMAGGNEGYFTAGASAEAGKRVAPSVWLHGSFTEGAAGELFATGNGTIMQARVGADAMPCSASGVLCAFVGADVGYQHTQFSGTSDPWFCDGDANDCMGNPIDESRSRAIGVARAGLDIGGTHLRWRPGIEAAFSGDGVNGVNLTQSIAYRF